MKIVHTFAKALFVALLCFSGPIPANAAKAKAHDVSAPAAAATAVSAPAPQASAAPDATATTEPHYAERGVTTCIKCHDKDPVTADHIQVLDILKGPHGVKADGRTPFGEDKHDCEACHGPSSQHVHSHPAPGDKRDAPSIVFSGPRISSVEDRNKICIGCHENGLRMNWQGSQHQNNDIACNDCHTVHVVKDPVLVKQTQPEKCFTCHAQQRAESFEYSHHPIREGKVVCSDCHNPHGSPGPKLLKEFTVNETCYNCHAEKRGPLLWEHQPVREDCTNCHTPHGSTEPRLMKERMQFLCTSCHSNIVDSDHGSAFGGAASIPKSPFGSVTATPYLANQRQCLNCHSQVHGSNSPSGALLFR